MRKQWSCPDLGEGAARYIPLPVPGCSQEFPECPAAFLRTGAEVGELKHRRGGQPFADHLIEGSIHPATIISTHAVEIENGARNVDTLTPKVTALVHIYLHEKAERDSYAMELRRAKHG